jgi:hypothetical protein
MTLRKFDAPRLPGWDGALIAAIATHRDQPFAWGQSDCITLVADAAAAMTGVDPLAALRGRYDSADGARALIRELGHRTLGGCLSATFSRIVPSFARRGDAGVVATLVDGKSALAAVVVMGDMLCGKSLDAAAGAMGMIFLPRSRLLRAYRVG